MSKSSAGVSVNCKLFWKRTTSVKFLKCFQNFTSTALVASSLPMYTIPNVLLILILPHRIPAIGDALDPVTLCWVSWPYREQPMQYLLLVDVGDERACHNFLLTILHPHGLCCPQGHPLPATQAPHDRHRDPILDYRCRRCGAVFNLFTGTCWSRSRHQCSTIVQIVQGIARGVPTTRLAEHLGVERKTNIRIRNFYFRVSQK